MTYSHTGFHSGQAILTPLCMSSGQLPGSDSLFWCEVTHIYTHQLIKEHSSTVYVKWTTTSLGVMSEWHHSVWPSSMMEPGQLLW